MTYDLLPKAAKMGIPPGAIEADMRQRCRNVAYGMRAFVLEWRKPEQVPLVPA